MPRQKSQHVDDPKEVGRRLKAARLRLGLSQRALSFPGCTPAYISRVEAGARTPSLQLLRRLGEQLGVSAEYLATGREEGDERSRLVEADVALRLDDLDTAERLYQGLLEEAAGSVDEARARIGLGQLAFRRGDVNTAIIELERAFELLGAARYEEPTAADTLARAYATAGQYEEAVGLLEQWLAAMTAQQNEAQAVRFRVLLANALIDTGSYGRAQAMLGEALAMSAEWANPLMRASMYWAQSRLHSLQEEPALAERYARRALEILELTELDVYQARAHQLLAFIELEQGNAAEALELLRRGRALLADSGGAIEQAKFKLEEARALAQLGETEEAAALAMEVMPTLSGADPQDAGRAYQVLADVFAAVGDVARARELYELAIETLERHGAPYLADAYTRFAELLEREGSAGEAFEMLKRAVQVKERVRRPL
jgi:tetratricopeptide (TPR) repeat protein